jgi:NAD(P)-dependent dehydrogenase (short-subunit alcohol dehydrogenase family)
MPGRALSPLWGVDVMDKLFDVSGEIVLVTGAAGQLGAQYCRAFLDRSARVVGLDLKPSAASEMLTKGFPEHFHFQASDVTRRDSLDAALANIEKQFGTPTVLINNAAIDSPPDAPLSENGPFEDYPDDSWDRVMNVNVKGVYLCCKIFGAAMARAGRGSIINVSSIYGVVSPDQSIYDYRRQRGETFYKPVAYSVSKSALLNLTRYLAVYWAKQNVRVNTLVIAGVFNNQEDAFLAAYCGRIPVGRMARKDEYDGTVLFLASPGSSYMTGSTLTADGGWTAI